MKTITTQLFSYAELSETAKQTAFKTWLKHNDDMPCISTDEVKKLVSQIEEVAQTRVFWEFDTYSYSVSVDGNRLYNDEVELSEIKGLKAVKVAMSIYYSLTKKIYAYVAHNFSHITNSKKYTKTWQEYVDNWANRERKYLPNRYAMAGSYGCFTGHYISDTFSNALWQAVAGNGASNNLSVADYLNMALEVTFKDVQSDYENMFTQQYFEQTIDDEEIYNADGNVVI